MAMYLQGVQVGYYASEDHWKYMGMGAFFIIFFKGTVLHSGKKVGTQTDLQLPTELS